MLSRLEAVPRDPSAAKRLRDVFLKHFSDLDPAFVVAGTFPIRHEIDPMPLMEALAAKGHPLCLPVLTEKYQPLVFRAYKPGDTLKKGKWGLSEPPSSAPDVVPAIVLTPLLAFDRAGHRLGYGAGYYDATLSGLRARGKVLAIGLAYALQETPSVPVNERDQPLDAIVTEREVILPPAGQAKGQGL